MWGWWASAACSQKSICNLSQPLHTQIPIHWIKIQVFFCFFLKTTYEWTWFKEICLYKQKVYLKLWFLHFPEQNQPVHMENTATPYGQYADRGGQSTHLWSRTEPWWGGCCSCPAPGGRRCPHGLGSPTAPSGSEPGGREGGMDTLTGSAGHKCTI